MDTLSSRTSKRNTPTYTVYALIDPRDSSVRYIGITKDIYSRMRQHSRCEGSNTAKNEWVQELQREQLMFIMHSIEKAKTFEMALERETALIRAHLAAGASLLNIAGVLYTPRSAPVYADRKQEFRTVDTAAEDCLTPRQIGTKSFLSEGGQIVNVRGATDEQFEAFRLKIGIRVAAKGTTKNTTTWSFPNRCRAINHALKYGLIKIDEIEPAQQNDCENEK